jgi:hypothetical protein
MLNFFDDQLIVPGVSNLVAVAGRPTKIMVGSNPATHSRYKKVTGTGFCDVNCPKELENSARSPIRKVSQDALLTNARTLLASYFDSFDDLRLPRTFRPTWAPGSAISGVQKVDHLGRTVLTEAQERTDDRPSPTSASHTMDQYPTLVQLRECFRSDTLNLFKLCTGVIGRTSIAEIRQTNPGQKLQRKRIVTWILRASANDPLETNR